MGHPAAFVAGDEGILGRERSAWLQGTRWPLPTVPLPGCGDSGQAEPEADISHRVGRGAGLDNVCVSLIGPRFLGKRRKWLEDAAEAIWRAQQAEAWEHAQEAVRRPQSWDEHGLLAHTLSHHCWAPQGRRAFQNVLPAAPQEAVRAVGRAGAVCAAELS